MGKDLSVGLSIAWQISAQEAAAAKYRFIEKEHILIGICSLEKVTGLMKEQKSEPLTGENELQLEKEDVQLVLSYFGLDVTQTRRQLRRLMGTREYSPIDNIIHRSDECKQIFRQAEVLSSSDSTSVLHFLAALMQDPGSNITYLLAEKSIKPQDVADFALSIANQQEQNIHPGPKQSNLQCLSTQNALESKAPSTQPSSLEDEKYTVPDEIADKVHFSVISPETVSPGSTFVIDIWAHLEDQRDKILQLSQQAIRGDKIRIRTKGPFPIQRGTILTIKIAIEDLNIDEREDTIVWTDKFGLSDFRVYVPQTAVKGLKSGLATIHANGIQIGRIYFSIQVGDETASNNVLDVEHRTNTKAFASYASVDREYVLSCIQGMQKIAPKLEIFLDVASMRSGQFWEEELWRIIPSNDVFFLFWSRNAAKSEWVEKEWKCALKTRGIDFIDPVPLEDPEIVPPPTELSSKHFGDWTLAYKRQKS